MPHRRNPPPDRPFTDFGAEARPAAHNDEALLLLAALRNRALPRPRSARAHQLRMGALGLLSGLTVVVPLVLGLTGRLPGFERRAQSRPPNAQGEAIRPAAKPPIIVSAPAPAERPNVEPDPAIEARRVAADRVETARALLARGEVARVREILGEAVLDWVPEALFLLAETYDPNVLAGRNLSGVGVGAETGRARQLYAKALAGGIEQARQRLDALK